MNVLRACLCVAMLLAIGACGDAGPEIPLTGDWSGTGSGINLTVTLSEDSAGVVTGDGTIAGIGPTVSVIITGSRDNTSVSLRIRPAGFEALRFTGELTSSGNSIVGEVDRSGFANAPFTMQRR